MFIAKYVDTTPLLLPNNVLVNVNDCFLVVPGKGLVHIFDYNILQDLYPIESQLPMKRITLNNRQMFTLWQLFTPRNENGIKPAI